MSNAGALRSVRGGSTPSPPISLGTRRLRPGERPVWVDLQLAAAQVNRWRKRSATHGLPVDVWLGILLEYWIVCRQLREIGGDALVEKLVNAAERAAAEPRLAPTTELQRWLKQLDGSEPPMDDLPSVVLAARLLAQLPHDGRDQAIVSAAESESERQAILLERVGSAFGQTSEAWAYLAATRAAGI
jgi:hypothetical protein